MSTSIVIPLTGEPGTDMYWHEWAVIQFDFEFDFDYKRKVIEPVVSSVTYDEYNEDDEYVEDSTEYFKKLEEAFAAKDMPVKVQSASLAFAGE